MKFLYKTLLITFVSTLTAIPFSSLGDVRLEGEVSLTTVTRELEELVTEQKSLKYYIDFPVERNKYYIEYDLSHLPKPRNDKQIISWNGEFLYIIRDCSIEYNTRINGPKEERIYNSGEARIYTQKFPDGMTHVGGVLCSAVWRLCEPGGIVDNGKAEYVGGTIIDRGDPLNPLARRNHYLTLNYSVKYKTGSRLIESIDYFAMDDPARLVAKVTYISYHDVKVADVEIPKEIKVHNNHYISPDNVMMTPSEYTVYIHRVSEVFRESYTPEPPGEGLTIVGDFRLGLDVPVTYNAENKWPSVEEVKNSEEYKKKVIEYSRLNGRQYAESKSIVMYVILFIFGLALFFAMLKFNSVKSNQIK